MFQRLKGFNLDSFLDSKIAEEQAKQQRGGTPPQTGGAGGSRRPGAGGAGGSRSASTARTDSPSKRSAGRLRAPDAGDGLPGGKSPDPEEFVIGEYEGSDVSRVPTPRPDKEGVEEGAAEKKEDTAGETPTKGKDKVSQGEDGLPEDVRKKLARLETLTAKYQDLLRNYRTAHARATTIEPFEATLREHTPLTTISEPGALVEFLNQRSLQSDMVLEELKRISGEHKSVVKERDELKVKLDDAEKRAKDAFDEAAGLREQRASAETDEPTKQTKTDPLGVGAVNEETTKSESAPAAGDDEFFSFEAESKKGLEEQLKEHQAEVQQHKEYINELSTENASLHQSLDSCRLDLEAMKNKISIKDRDLSAVRKELAESLVAIEKADQAREWAQGQEMNACASLAQTEAQVLGFVVKLRDSQAQNAEDVKALETQIKVAKQEAATAGADLQRHRSEHEENLKSGVYAQRDTQILATLRNTVNVLKEQAREAETARDEATSKFNDLKFEIVRLESESTANSKVIEVTRNQVRVAEEKLHVAQTERDEAQKLAGSKKGHEMAVASLRSQLKRAEKDRDGAYQMILNCGKCSVAEPTEALENKDVSTPTGTMTPDTQWRVDSETTEQTEASTQPTEVSTPSVDGEPAEPDSKKKNKKKKSKAKKKAPGEALASPSESPSSTKRAGSVQGNDLARSKSPTSLNPAIRMLASSLDTMRRDGESNDEEREAVLRHHENHIEELMQSVKNKEEIIKARDDDLMRAVKDKEDAIKAKDAQIEALDTRNFSYSDNIRALESQKAILKEEVEFVRGELTDLGGEITDAKHEAQQAKETRQKLQEELDELQVVSDHNEKELKAAEQQRRELTVRCDALQAEVSELRANQSQATASSDELQGVKEQLQSAQKENESVQLAKAACEKQIEELKAVHSASGAELDAKHKALSADFDELRSKSSSLESDLGAANTLAQDRFKTLTELRERLGQLEPELKRLRKEVAELQTIKADLAKSNSAITKLENKERDLKSEITEYKRQGSDKDSQIAILKDESKKNSDRNSVLEESYEDARKALEKSQRIRDEAVEARDKLKADVARAEEEAKRSKSRLGPLEEQVKKLNDEASRLREENKIKSSQHANTQGMIDSMQDQARELATQMRELRERNESVEEQLADAQRMLSERGREGDTMRRMLAEVEGRAESRVKEMRERMDLAIEERDRAEDESNNVSRRKAREIEDLKTRLRDVERDAARATEAREDAERREREFRTRESDIEKRAAQAQEELGEVRTAMSQLRVALDESERQCRELEKERSEVRRAVEEREQRLEKLQKSSKSMAEELRSLQTTNKLRQGSVQSSRSSVDSSRVTSPVSRGNNGVPTATGEGAHPKDADFFYLKNVLLQFLQQKEKKHQLQMIHPLGQLLRFDSQDEKKWQAAISAMR